MHDSMWQPKGRIAMETSVMRLNPTNFKFLGRIFDCREAVNLFYKTFYYGRKACLYSAISINV